MKLQTLLDQVQLIKTAQSLEAAKLAIEVLEVALKKEIEETPETFTVQLVGLGPITHKISAIKEMRTYAGLGLKEAKDISETSDAIVSRYLSAPAAKALSDALERCGWRNRMYGTSEMSKLLYDNKG